MPLQRKDSTAGVFLQPMQDSLMPQSLVSKLYSTPNKTSDYAKKSSRLRRDSTYSATTVQKKETGFGSGRFF
ncbi:hypothetical protein SRABI96_05241 [Peribacillus sp. Bi96]|nr:hypothetical protein SRABI96_05241 [Peribacillus sp. Bi96]